MSTVNVLRPTTHIVCRNNKFEVGIPNIGEYIQIESLKQALTQGRYALMAYGALETSEKALDLVDAIVYFTVLAGEKFLKTYGVKSHEELLNMSIVDSQELTNQYKEVYAPFYNSIVERKDRPIQKLEHEKKEETNTVQPAPRPEFVQTPTEEETVPQPAHKPANQGGNVIYSSSEEPSAPSAE